MIMSLDPTVLLAGQSFHSPTHCSKCMGSSLNCEPQPQGNKFGIYSWSSTYVVPFIEDKVSENVHGIKELAGRTLDSFMSCLAYRRS